MKKIILLIAAVLPLMVAAQSALEGVFDKYSGKDGFTTVNIGPEMFQLLASCNIDFEGDTTLEYQEVQKALEQLNGLRILTCEDAGSDLCLRFKKDINKNMPGDYQTLMTVKDGDSDIQFLANQKKDGSVTEFLMLVIDSEDVVLMSFTGKIELNTLMKIGQTMQGEGFINL